MTAKDIATFYANNPRDVFNACIDAIVACDQDYTPLAVALEIAGLEIIINHVGDENE